LFKKTAVKRFQLNMRREK